MIASPAAAVAEAHRLFYALLPPADVAAEIGEYRDTFGVKRSPVADHRLHVTLALSPDYNDYLPEALVAKALAAGQSIVEKPFGMLLQRAVGSAGSVALRPGESLPSLTGFQERLVRVLAAAGFALRPGWRFDPHVTLGYRKGDPFDAPILPLSWTATEFVLIHSHVGLTRHDILARWPLGKSQADPSLRA